MTVLNIIMWLMSTGHVTLNFEKTFRGFFWENGIQDSSVLEDDSNPVVLSQLVMECIEVCHRLFICTKPPVKRPTQFIIGDAIVTWRAWVLWDRDRRILYASLILILGSVGQGPFLSSTALSADSQKRLVPCFFRRWRAPQNRSLYIGMGVQVLGQLAQ